MIKLTFEITWKSGNGNGAPCQDWDLSLQFMFLKVTLTVGVTLNTEYAEVRLEGNFYWENPFLCIS